jgi:hypothetical protein
MIERYCEKKKARETRGLFLRNALHSQLSAFFSLFLSFCFHG